MSLEPEGYVRNQARMSYVYSKIALQNDNIFELNRNIIYKKKY